MSEQLDLKWGTIRGWRGLSERSIAIVQRWADLGSSLSAMMQHDTEEQKKIICELIDSVASSGGTIYNCWDGKDMTVEAAKEYVTNYRKGG